LWNTSPNTFKSTIKKSFSLQPQQQQHSKSASTIHTVFRIPTHGYLSVLPKLNPVLTKLKNAYVIIIDEMSMMTSNMLCAVEQRLRQSTLTTCTFSFQNKLLILVGDFAQLPTICTHTPKAPDIICRACHITSAPCWAIAKQHTFKHMLDIHPTHCTSNS
jgi:hypothetical protein